MMWRDGNNEEAPADWGVIDEVRKGTNRNGLTAPTG